jgi:hypothetical protein
MVQVWGQRRLLFGATAAGAGGGWGEGGGSCLLLLAAACCRLLLLAAACCRLLLLAVACCCSPKKSGGRRPLQNSIVKPIFCNKILGRVRVCPVTTRQQSSSLPAAAKKQAASKQQAAARLVMSRGRPAALVYTCILCLLLLPLLPDAELSLSADSFCTTHAVIRHQKLLHQRLHQLCRPALLYQLPPSHRHHRDKT